MTSDLDDAVHAHLAGMPDTTRRLLEPVLREDAADGWLRDALMAYLRHFVRVFVRGEPLASAEPALAGELVAVTGGSATGDDDADITDAEAALTSGFVERGLRFLGGRTPPYLGAYIWSRTEDRRFTGSPDRPMRLTGTPFHTSRSKVMRRHFWMRTQPA